jgi:hypothetical protein
MRYQALFCQVWHDQKFLTLSDDAKLLFLYIISSPHSNSIGLYRLPKKYIECDLGWRSERLAIPFGILLAERFIFYHDETQLVFVRNHLKYNPVQNEKHSIACVNIVNALPAVPSEFSGILEWLTKPYHKPLVVRLQERLAIGYAIPETETETVTRTPPTPPSGGPPAKPKKPPAKYNPPTGDELQQNGHGWLDAKSWDDFVAHRSEIKKPLTEKAVEKSIALLQAHCGDQREIIETSIRSGWQGLFPLKHNAGRAADPRRQRMEPFARREYERRQAEEREAAAAGRDTCGDTQLLPGEARARGDRDVP